MKKASALIAVAGLAGVVSADGLQVGDFVWTLNDNAGGSGTANGGNNTLNITGGDSGFGGETSLTAIAPSDGTVTGFANFTTIDSPGFDFGFYEVNGANTTFVGSSGNGSAQVTFSVSAGDSFGFGVSTVDGIFGPGTLSVSDFRFIPAPSSLALLGLGGLVAGRRRR